jgi:cytochrome bd-type quinol oxidase subunit 2
VIVKAANIIALIAGIAAVIIIIIAGINFILSSGDSAKTGRAREAIIYAAVGLAVIVLSRAIITFIVSRV